MSVFVYACVCMCMCGSVGVDVGVGVGVGVGSRGETLCSLTSSNLPRKNNKPKSFLRLNTFAKNDSLMH